MSEASPFARPAPGYETQGQPSAEQVYSDGFRPGDIKYAYGVLSELLALNPGWALADGTVTLRDGSTPPDLRDRFLVGAGTTYALGATGGSATIAAHTHSFTQPNNHVFTQPTAHAITQPVFGDHSAHDALVHDANHAGAAAAAHGNHSGTDLQFIEFTATGLAAGGGTGWYAHAPGAVGLGLHQKSLAHTNNHTVTQPNAHSNHTVSAHSAHNRTTDVALTNNHAGGAVDPHAGGAVGAVVGSPAQLPPYAALYCLIKRA